jgi:hypothetical protein
LPSNLVAVTVVCPDEAADIAAPAPTALFSSNAAPVICSKHQSALIAPPSFEGLALLFTKLTAEIVRFDQRA